MGQQEESVGSKSISGVAQTLAGVVVLDFRMALLSTTFQEFHLMPYLSKPCLCTRCFPGWRDSVRKEG